MDKVTGIKLFAYSENALKNIVLSVNLTVLVLWLCRYLNYLSLDMKQLHNGKILASYRVGIDELMNDSP